MESLRAETDRNNIARKLEKCKNYSSANGNDTSHISRAIQKLESTELDITEILDELERGRAPNKI